MGIVSWPYSTFTILALGAVCLGSFVRLVRLGCDSRKITCILIITGISAFLGARGMYLATNPDTPLNRFFDFTFHNFSLFGGLALATISGIGTTNYFKFSTLKVADVMAPLVGIGIAIMRIGCVLHGCCFGVETDLPWGLRFPFLSPAHMYQLKQAGGNPFIVRPVHPTQLYELVAVLVISVFTFFIAKRTKFDGVAAANFSLGFSAFRLINHFLRPTSSIIYPVMYLFIMGVSMVFIVFKSNHTKPYMNDE